jgi:5-oxoprolinase (ATP-hydrolysing)
MKDKHVSELLYSHLPNEVIISADRGGTFTDLLIRDHLGIFRIHKVPSRIMDQPQRLQQQLQCMLSDIDKSLQKQVQRSSQSSSKSIPPILHLKLGTTLVTNALLEQKGVPCALLITEGFEDLFLILNQKRQGLFALNPTSPKQIPCQILGVKERMNASGNILRPIVDSEIKLQLIQIKQAGIESLAIVLMHAWKNPTHEQQIAYLARQVGFRSIFLSSVLHQQIAMIPRGQSCLIEAYLQPILQTYLQKVVHLNLSTHNPIHTVDENLTRSLNDVSSLNDILLYPTHVSQSLKLSFMQSNGYLSEPSTVRASDSILSGPAGGVVAAHKLAQSLHHSQVLTLDMGGTSTDVSRIDHQIPHVTHAQLNGLHFHADFIDIQTVAAGGGSIITYAQGRLQVGPHSAGSDPGPACYGWGGPLTVTDANLILGRFVTSDFPKIFGADHQQSIDSTYSFTLFKELQQKINSDSNHNLSVLEVALGAIEIAEEKMARALKSVSIHKGYDLREHMLYPYGAAAPLHVCALLKKLHIKGAVIHPLASVFSSYGIYQSNLAHTRSITYLAPFDKINYLQAIQSIPSYIMNQMQLPSDTWHSQDILIAFDLRKSGRDTSLTINDNTLASPIGYELIRARYRDAIEKEAPLFEEDDDLEIVHIHIRIQHSSLVKEVKFSQVRLNTLDQQDQQDQKKPASDRSTPLKSEIPQQQVYFDKKYWHCPIMSINQLTVNQKTMGPVLIKGAYFTCFIEPHYTVYKDLNHHLIIHAHTPIEIVRHTLRTDPIQLEIFHHRFESLADQMGEVLKKQALSVSIKERSDFSCALFDAQGEIIASAPHVPVHLASMGDTVKDLIQKKQNEWQHADVYITNSPACGGSHLPDITAITPIMIDNKVVVILANRAHHADVGGITPGSMPAFSKSLLEEGVCFAHHLIFRDHKIDEAHIQSIFQQGPYPCRNIEQRIGDLKAQISANHKGLMEWLTMLGHYDLPYILYYMQALKDQSEIALKKSLLRFLGSRTQYQQTWTDRLDDGSELSVYISLKTQKAQTQKAQTQKAQTQKAQTQKVEWSNLTLDIHFYAQQEHSGNLNCPPSVCRAAVFYVLRLLIQEDIPLNAGCLRVVRIHLPQSTMLDPSPTAAVVGGNVETSQRLVDLLLAAFGLSAASQGTMNNLTFADLNDHRLSYYETIAGGQGANQLGNGCSGIQVHMTNTPITDPEIIELRFPYVLLDQFAYRKGSGGRGRFTGGDGVIRQFTFLAPTAVSILSERRQVPAFGLLGGQPGEVGVNLWYRNHGHCENLGGKAYVEVEAGDRICLQTPGGGGYGIAVDDDCIENDS